MAETTLVEPKIRVGAELVQLLDSALGEVFAAFWYRDPESEDWRLVIGSDVVDRLGPTAANRRFLDALQQNSYATPPHPSDEGTWLDWSSLRRVNELISPLEIELVGRQHPLIEQIRYLSTQPITLRTPMHIYRTVLGNHYIDDAYVYRSVIHPVAIQSQEVLGTPPVLLTPPAGRKRRRKLPLEEGSDNEKSRG